MASGQQPANLQGRVAILQTTVRAASITFETEGFTCFNDIGKWVAEHVIKGTMIMVTGRIHYTKCTDATIWPVV